MKKYKIGEFAEIVGLSSYTLRYYEGEGLIVANRDANGIRYFTDEDIKWLGFLMHLRGTGMSISDLKKYVKLRANGDTTIDERVQLLKKVKEESEAEIRVRQNNLEVLSRKIDWYEGKLDATIPVNQSFEDYLKKFE